MGRFNQGKSEGETIIKTEDLPKSGILSLTERGSTYMSH